MDHDIKSTNPKFTNNNWVICNQTKSLLLQLDEVIENVIAKIDPNFKEMIRSTIKHRGKRLRPTLLFLIAQFGNNFDNSKLIRAAAAIELLHNASLYHDDVIDRAPLRRGSVSFNFRWGNRLATFSGTYLFAIANKIITSLGEIPNQLASKAYVELCTGQLHEIENAYNLDLTKTTYLNLLSQKTASLFVFPCQLSIHLSDVSPSQTAKIVEYSRNLGIAFQLVDDGLDLYGHKKTLGKEIGRDLREGTYSLAILQAINQNDSKGKKLREILEQPNLTNEDVKEVLRLIQESGEITNVLNLAKEFMEKACNALNNFPKTPACQSLYNLSEYIITRSH